MGQYCGLEKRRGNGEERKVRRSSSAALRAKLSYHLNRNRAR
jgi:hypothetical protein